MGSHSNSINCWKCGCDYAVIVYETRPFIGPNNEEGIADEWGYCNRCGYSYGKYTMGQIGEDYETMKPLSDLNYERTEWKEDREYTHLVGGQSFIPMTENLDPYTEKEYKTFPDFPIPEYQKENIQSMILLIKKIYIKVKKY